MTTHVTKAELDQMIAREWEKASASGNGRSAIGVLKDGRLRQTVVALLGGYKMDDHAKPESAILQVLRGTITVNWDAGSKTVEHGGFFILPDAVHNVVATEDSAFLLTSLAG